MWRYIARFIILSPSSLRGSIFFSALFFSLIPGSGPLHAQEAWPSSWRPMLDVNWELMTDPSNDHSPAAVDVINDPNTCSYYYATSTSMFYRMALRGNPQKNATQLTSYAWMASIDANGDGVLDWTIQALGVSDVMNVIFQTSTITTSYSSPLVSGYVRVTEAGTNLYFLDMQIPFSALQTRTPAVTYTTPIRFFFHTSTSEAVDIKDATVPSADFTAAFNLSGTTTPSGGNGAYGSIYDTRDTSPYSSSGIWNSNETVLLTGSGWPGSGSSYYNSGVRNVRIKNAENTVQWTGTVTTNSSGSFSDASAWTLPLSAASGVYIIEVEDPRSAGTWKSYDTFTVNQLTEPEMDVKGNNVSIANGDSSPSPDDHTDFGSVNVVSGTVVRTFTIQNNGNADLNLTGDPSVSLSGFSDFTVTSQPSTPVASGGGTTTFQITFSPSSTGEKTATVSIANDDGDNNPYVFDIKGTGVLTYTVSGTINDGSDPLEGVLVSFSDGTSVTTGEGGTYSKTVSSGDDLTVTPTKIGWSFEPVFFSWENIQENKVQNFEGARFPGLLVTGQGYPIPNGDDSPALLKGTDFGGTTVYSGSVIRTFIISNTGGTPLILSRLSVTGPNAAGFEISFSETTISAGDSVAMTVRFRPSFVGIHRAAIQFDTNDSENPSFSFAIAGRGENPVTRIGDRVWHDVNRNGILDAGEKGLANITVVLSDTSGRLIATAVTDANGYYLFSGLRSKAYYISVNQFDEDMPDNFVSTTGNDPARVVLRSGESRLDVDFGFAEKDPDDGIIGGYTWHDSNWNRIIDEGEAQLPFVMILLNLLDDQSNMSKAVIDEMFQGGTPRMRQPGIYPRRGTTVDSVKTNYFGRYQFIRRPAGPYMVYANHYGSDPEGNWAITSIDSQYLELGTGQIVLDVDFGFAYPSEAIPGSIGDLVWHDRNGDGRQDVQEQGIPGVRINLFAGNTIAASAVTDETGHYLFENLSPGEYSVHVDETSIPDSYVRTFPPRNTHPVFVSAGLHCLDADFGYAQEKDWGLDRKSLFARYQTWYGGAGSDSTLRHWSSPMTGGVADTSLMAFYDASDPALLEYHILLAWASGIDGFVVDWYGKNSFENAALGKLLDKADSLWMKYHTYGFNFEVIVSYNESAKGALDSNFVYLADSIMTRPSYGGMRRNVRRPVFIETRSGTERFAVCADTILPWDHFLVSNYAEKSSLSRVSATYPSINTVSNDLGPDPYDWAEDYLDSTYTIAAQNDSGVRLRFVTGGLWPGYDDRNWAGGVGQRISRQGTRVYENTWEKVHQYQDSLPMPWSFIETWNDHNRGTAIEPSLGWSYRFNVLTRDHARIWKSLLPADSVGVENAGLLVPQHIKQARIAARIRPGEADSIRLKIDQALVYFFNREHNRAIYLADDAAGIASGELTVNAVNDSSVRIVWKPARHANQYHVYFTADSSTFEPCSFGMPGGVIVGNDTAFVLTGLMPNTVYYFAVAPIDTNLGWYANEGWYNRPGSIVRYRMENTVHVDDLPAVDLPEVFALYNNYPNPFNPNTHIKYALPKSQRVSIRVFDILGREVATLVDQYQEPGYHLAQWDASSMASGIYFCVLQTEEFRAVRKMSLIK